MGATITAAPKQLAKDSHGCSFPAIVVKLEPHLPGLRVTAEPHRMVVAAFEPTSLPRINAANHG
jgi:hypothetical protein